MPAVEAGDVVWRIYGDTTDLNGALVQAEQNINRVSGNVQRQIGASMVALGATITGVLGLSANAAIAWESAFTGVRKTTDATVEEFAALEKALIDLSMEIPVAAIELAKLAEIGGQMGVPREALVEFTKTIAILGETTNLAGEEGAAMLAQFANVAQVPKDQYSNLAATIVSLGNSGSSSELQIMEMGQRIAAAGTLAGMTAPDILAFASSLADVGINAEAGGSAMSRLIVSIFQAVETGDGLEDLADVAGMTGEAFKTAFNDDPANAIASIISGLKRMSDAGENVFGVLGKIGVEGVVMTNVTLSASLAADGMTAALQRGNEAFAENNAHLTEMAKRGETAESKIQIFKNAIFALQEAIGDALKDRLAARAEQFTEFAKQMLEVARAHPELLARLTEFASILGIALLAVGTFVMALPGITLALGAISFPAIAAGAAIFALVGIFAAVAVAVYEWATAWAAIPENMEKLNSFLGAAGAVMMGIWEGIVGIFRAAVDAIKGTFADLGGSVNFSWQGIVEIFVQAGEWITGVLGWLADGVGMAFDWIGGILVGAVEWTWANWDQLVQIFQNAITGIMLICGLLWEGLKLGFQLIWNILSAVFGQIMEGWAEIAGVAGDESATWLDVVQIMQEKTIAFLEALSAGFDRFVGFVNWAWPAIAMAANIGANLFIEPIMWMVDQFMWAVDYITWAMDKLGGAWDWLTGAGLAGGDMQITGPVGLATGGTVEQAGWALVGERGPELVNLPAGSTVYDAQQTAQARGGAQPASSNSTVNVYLSGTFDLSSRDASQRIGQMIADETAARLRSAGAFA